MRKGRRESGGGLRLGGKTSQVKRILSHPEVSLFVYSQVRSLIPNLTVQDDVEQHIEVKHG